VQDGLLTIGRFARLCRLSVKQLRHYDELGLLRPDRVDPATGYRYYATARVRDALTVALLRDLDVPLPVIAELLAAGDAERVRLLGLERDRLAARIARDTERLAVLERLAEGPVPAYEVELVDEPALRLATVRTRSDAAEVGARIGECLTALFEALGGSTAAWSPPLYGLFPLDLEDGMTIAAGGRADGAVPGTVLGELPAGPAATTLHTGPYEQIPLAYHALFAWIHERGLTARGPAYEHYLVAPGEAEPHELLTRLTIPLDPSQEIP
jgi:DNA-binding transcriptional MerR regulator